MTSEKSILEYFFVHRLSFIKTTNQLSRRRLIYKGFGVDFFLRDGNDNIVGIPEIHNLISTGSQVMIVLLALNNGRINVRYDVTKSKFIVTFSGAPDIFRVGEEFDDYEFIHKAVTKGLDVKIY